MMLAVRYNTLRIIQDTNNCDNVLIVRYRSLADYNDSSTDLYIWTFIIAYLNILGGTFIEDND